MSLANQEAQYGHVDQSQKEFAASAKEIKHRSKFYCKLENCKYTSKNCYTE